MNFLTLVDRVRADFVEMPGLELTLSQAVRLFNLGVEDCRHVLDTLVEAGFLRWTAARTVVRTGRTLIVAPEVQRSYASVREPFPADNSVG